MRHSFLILLISLSVQYTAQAQKPIARLMKIAGFTSFNDTVINTKPKNMVAPIVFYTPDTRWAMGAVFLTAFHMRSKTDSSQFTRMSYVKFINYYTLNKQYDAQGAWNIFSPNENYLFKGEAKFKYYPDRFYGIGNQSSLLNEEKFEFHLFRIKSLFMKRFGKKLFLGFDYEFEREYKFKYDELGQLIQGNILGFNGATGSALGLVSVYDSRDNALNAYQGTLAELSSYYFGQKLGSTYRFVEINGEYRKYVELKPKHILAFNSTLRLTIGDVPFLDLSRLGGEDILRGYPSNRFIDKNMFASQMEYRFPLFRRLGMTTFIGAGEIFNKLETLQLKNIKYAAGVGLRFLVNPKERVNIRLDYALGREGGHFYFSVSEAF